MPHNIPAELHNAIVASASQAATEYAKHAAATSGSFGDSYMNVFTDVYERLTQFFAKP